MRALAGAIALAVCLSGCLGATPETRDTPLPDAEPADWSWRLIGNASYLNGQREAFLAANATTLLTCAHGDFERPSWMFASDDGGRTWRELAGPLGLAPSGDCEIAANGPHWVFLHSTVAGATIVTTEDGGETWSVNHLSALPINGQADRPWLGYVGDVLLMTWMSVTFQPGPIGFSRSFDHGVTWEQSRFLVDVDPAEPFVIQGDFVVHNGTAYVPLVSAARPLADATLSLAVSRDQGQTWTVEAGPGTGYFTNPSGVGIDGRGTLHWLVADGDGFRLSSRVDGTWSQPMLIEPSYNWARPALAGLAQGGAIMTWESDGALFERDGPVVAAATVAANGTVESIEPLLDGAMIEFGAVLEVEPGRVVAAVPHSCAPRPSAGSTCTDSFVRIFEATR